MVPIPSVYYSFFQVLLNSTLSLLYFPLVECSYWFSLLITNKESVFFSTHFIIDPVIVSHSFIPILALFFI